MALEFAKADDLCFRDTVLFVLKLATEMGIEEEISVGQLQKLLSELPDINSRYDLLLSLGTSSRLLSDLRDLVSWGYIEKIVEYDKDDAELYFRLTYLGMSTATAVAEYLPREKLNAVNEALKEL